MCFQSINELKYEIVCELIVQHYDSMDRYWDTRRLQLKVMRLVDFKLSNATEIIRKHEKIESVTIRRKTQRPNLRDT